MVQNRRVGARIFYAAILVILGILTFSCLYPLWYTFCVSVSAKAAASSGQVTIWPVGFTLASYQEIMGDSAFLNSFWISIKRTVLGTSVSMIVMVMLAYPLSKNQREFRARNVLIWIVIFCMVFHGGTIPWYLTMQNYGLIDNIWGLVLGGSLPVFNVILIMNFFRNLPKDLEEAASIDGAGPWQTLLQIVVPCSVPVLATVMLFVSVYHWNEFFQGLVLTSGEAHYPLQTYIKQMVVNIPMSGDLSPEALAQLDQLSNKSLDAAKVFIAIIPMLIVYPFLQKYFVNGITLGAVKE